MSLSRIAPTALIRLTAFLALGAPLTSHADQFGDFEYSTDGAAVTITYYTGAGGDVVIPNMIEGLPVTAIGDGETVFWRRGSVISVVNVVIPHSVTTIGDSAFAGCPDLNSVSIPESVISIGRYAFRSCRTLTNVIIPNSVTAIGEMAFSGCTNMTSITVLIANEFYRDLDGVLYSKDLTMLIRFPGGKSGDYNIPEGVVRITDSAFASSSNLSSVSIPDSVTSIGKSAFQDCSRMITALIGEGVVTIGERAFAGCSSLSSVSIPDSVNTISRFAFYFCDHLTSLMIGNSVTTIDVQAFAGCTRLLRLTIPASVTTIGADAFSACSSLQSMYFAGDMPKVGPTEFWRTDNVTVYYLPNTSGWRDTLAGRPVFLWNPLITNPVFNADSNSIAFTISGTDGIPIVIEYTDNVLGGEWSVLVSNTLAGGILEFEDGDSGDLPTRVYRVAAP